MQVISGEGFVVEDRVDLTHSPPATTMLEGQIRCQHGLFVDVEKILEVQGTGSRARVRTIRYSYHAGVEGSADRAIFRYDNFHAYAREGNPDAHHKHRFDHTIWQEIPPPEWIGEERWPHLSDVLEELRAWWESTGQFLDR